MLRGVKSAIGLIVKMVNFEARAPKLYIHVMGLNMRLFFLLGKIRFPPPLVLRGVKSAIGLIFKMGSFEARAPKY